MTWVEAVCSRFPEVQVSRGILRAGLSVTAPIAHPRAFPGGLSSGTVPRALGFCRGLAHFPGNLAVPSSFPRSRLALPFLTWGRDLLPVGMMETR